MPSLRTLLSDLEPATVGNPNRVFYVVNTAMQANNGGRCCLWTAPAGSSKVTFEMWGAGGDGAGARCCESSGTMATNGSYAIKSVDTVAGCQYRICAASTGCSGFCCGITSRAFPSFVVDVTASTTIGCAVGGCGSCNQFTRGNMNGYICCWGLLSGTGLGDVVMDGTGNIGIKSQYCFQHMYQIVAGGWGSDRMTSAVCAHDMTYSGPSIMSSCQSGYSGGGTEGRACGGGFCTGQHGGFGIVKVSYS